MGETDPVHAAVFYAVFVISATLHEASHAWAAKRGGDLTAYHGGQVSLDPRPHMRREPMGMVVLPILTVITMGWPLGFASAPYDLRWARQFPKRAAWMSLAGPASNLALVVAAAVAIRAGVAAGVLHPPTSLGFGAITASNVSELWSGVGYVLGVVFSLNLVLFILNVLPIPPLDGAGIVPLALDRETAARWQNFTMQPALGWIGILLAWWILDAVFFPLFFALVPLLYPGTSYG